MNKLQELVEEIKHLQRELLLEIEKKEKEYSYRISGKRVYFEEATARYHKTLATTLQAYLATSPLLNILTAPVIWSCLAPAALLDLMVCLYQGVCFPVYGIPKVRRGDYIVIDRHSLRYLNPIEKINCIYCGYFNGLIAYVQEVAARTEQYWCPIKHARKLSAIHSRYHKFLDYGDHEEYLRRLEQIRRDFADLQEGD
ncbi:MAG: hypothetical protein AB1568_12145 [Thermodesulfobacteriota bacterium]